MRGPISCKVKAGDTAVRGEGASQAEERRVGGVDAL